MKRNDTIRSTPSISRGVRAIPKRPPSVLSNASLTSESSDATTDQLTARLARVNNPVLLSSTHKKYKAPLSTESRANSSPSLLKPPKPTPSPAPRTPTKKDGTQSRPRTPGTPRSRSGAESPSLMPATSEMDVSNVDPEQVLVDSQTVEPGDISGEIDEACVRAALLDHGQEDKVMVSIRIRPTNSTSAWIPEPSTNSLKLASNLSRATSTTSANANPANSSFNFDAVLTGTPNKPIYTTVARSHVQAAMEGYNSIVFAYGQTASGKTFTLSGDDAEPGIIPRAMRDVFGFIKRTPEREYLLRCSYLEIYNETIIDLLAPPMMAKANQVQIQGGPGGDIVLSPLREEVVISLKGVKDVLKRGEGNRRTACTDWNERSSRSHSVFRLVVESRERGSSNPDDCEDDVPSTPAPATNGRQTPGYGGRQTPGLNGRQTPGPGGPRLQARGGRSVQTSVLSLIDLAGSEKATSDKERTREGKYINTSLLTLGTVIGTLADNAAKHKNDHVPYRNSKLTRMLQPSLSGNARISVICTINPDVGAVSESTSTLLFAKRIKNVQLNAQKKEVVDTDALIERYRKEIEDLKARLAEREADAPVRTRRLSAQEQIDESKVMRDLNGRIQQLTKLILTSATVDEGRGDDDDAQPASPTKVDFDMSPYQLQQELLAARLQIESQANQILSLESSLLARPPLPADASLDEKNQLISEQTKTIRELEIVVRGYEENLGEPLRKVKEDVEKEWEEKLEEEMKKTEKSQKWAEELVKALEKEKKARLTLEEERRALAAFVSKFDALGLGLSLSSSKLRLPMPTPGGAMTAYEQRQSRSLSSSNRFSKMSGETITEESLGSSLAESSPIRLDRGGPSLFDQAMPDDILLGGVADISFDELEIERQLLETSICSQPGSGGMEKLFASFEKGAGLAKGREVFGDKENILP